MEAGEGKEHPGVKGVTISVKKGRFSVSARVDSMGPDILVTLWGGAAHIGALGMATPRPSLRDPDERSATSSVFTFPGHKEDVAVKLMSEMLSGRLNRKVVVVAGLHWDRLEPGDIRQIVDACKVLGERIALAVEKA
ncbi:MAG: hypothetical protein ABSE25_07425 [Syntrophorhabdales bacterium]|jgi:hypothetical protein